MKALAIVMLLAATSRADSLEEVVRARLEPSLPAGLGIAKVQLRAAEVVADRVLVETPRALHAGRTSVRVVVAGHASWAAVSIAPLVEVAVTRRAIATGEMLSPGDIVIEQRALDGVAPAPVMLAGAVAMHAIEAGAVVGAHDVTLAPPLARGTQVSIEIRRGAVRVHGTGVLETTARIGDRASARLAATRTVVHGTLIDSSTLVIGEGP
jgi:flagella basal body P-ring formation protein FlgA